MEVTSITLDMPVRQCLHYLITAFDDHAHKLQQLLLAQSLPIEVRYLCGQLEQAPSTNRVHLQAYIQLRQQKSIRAVQAILDCPGLHLEEQRGSNEQARDYCRKDDTRIAGPWECGEFCRGAGHRTDLTAVARASLDPARSFRSIVDEFPEAVLRYGGNIARIRRLADAPARHDQTVVLYWGDAGAGKSRAAHADLERACARVYSWSSAAEKWFDGYDQHDGLVLDDITGKESLEWFLAITGDGPCRVQAKGDSAPLTTKHIIITSNTCDDEWFGELSEQRRAAVRRRIHRRVHFVGRHPDVTIVGERVIPMVVGVIGVAGGNTDPSSNQSSV